MALLYCTHSAFYIAGRRLFNLRGFRWKWQRAAWLWQSGEQRSTLGVITDDSDGFISSVQFGHSVVYDPMDCSTPGFPVHHQLLEPAQTHSHQVSNAIQPSHPLSSPPPPPALNLSQHQGLFKWVSSLHQGAKGLEFQLHQLSFQWIFRTDLL